MSDTSTIPAPPSGTIVDSNPNAAGQIPPPPSGTIVDSPPAAHLQPPDPNDRFAVQGTGTISAIKPPAHIGEALEQWSNNVANDIKYGTDHTGVGTVLKKMGAHGVYAGNPEAVGDFMASLPLVAIKALRGAGKVAQGKVASGAGDVASGVAQAATMPAAFVAPEESVLSKEGLLNDAASVAGKASETVINAAKTVRAWTKANPIEALALEGVAHKLGVDPYQLTEKVIKYGKGLSGTP